MDFTTEDWAEIRKQSNKKYAAIPYEWAWEATPEIALEKAFQYKGIIAAFGEITLQTKIDELATRTNAIDFANNVLAKREQVSPQIDVLQLNAVNDYKAHIAYWKSCEANTSEFCAGLVYDSVNDGIIPSLNMYLKCLVVKNNRDHNFETNQPTPFFSVQNWEFLALDINNLISGYTLAHKIGELRAGKSHVAMVGNNKTHKATTTTSSIEIKPIFKPESIEIIYAILKDFFKPEQQPELLTILETGNDAKEPLLFLDNGIRLADAFKQLINEYFIIGCSKKDLENWIHKNFQFVYRKKVKGFSLRYLNDTISTVEDSCKRPILDIKKNKSTGVKEIQSE